MTNIVSDAQWLAALNASGAEDFDTGNAAFLRGKFVDEYTLLQLGDFGVEDMKGAIRCVTSHIALHSLVKRSQLRRVADNASYSVRRFEKGAGGTTMIVLGAA